MPFRGLNGNSVVVYITDMPDQPAPSTRILVSLPPDVLVAIDDFQFAHRIKSRSEAIRVLLRQGLNAEKAPKPVRRK